MFYRHYDMGGCLQRWKGFVIWMPQIWRMDTAVQNNDIWIDHAHQTFYGTFNIAVMGLEQIWKTL